MFNARPGRRRPGFTLVELLVVIVIVILVSAVALPAILPALNNRQVGEAARILQAALAGARDAAIRYNAPRGIRLIPDLATSGFLSTTTSSGVLNTNGTLSGKAQTLTSSRIVPIEPAPDLTDSTTTGSATFVTYDPNTKWTTGSAPRYPFPVEATVPNRGVYPFVLPLGTPSAQQVLMVTQAWFISNNFALGLPNPPTNWFWNVRIGDKFRFTDSGRYYTVVGPMTVPNPENLVNDGAPGVSTLNVHYGPSAPSGVDVSPEFLFLVNGIDDNKNGYVDDGIDGINQNYAINTFVDEITTATDASGNLITEWWETEQWQGAMAPVWAGVSTGVLPAPTFKYTIARRPVPSPGAREVTLPAGAVIDLTTFDQSINERSRLPVDPYSFTVDILMNQAGQVIPTTLYSSPSSSSMDQSFYHFWISDRSDVHPPEGSTFPLLPMPAAAGNQSQYPGDALLTSPPVRTRFLKKERQLLTLFTKTGQILTNSIENFSSADKNAPYYDAQLGIREAK